MKIFSALVELKVPNDKAFPCNVAYPEFASSNFVSAMGYVLDRVAMSNQTSGIPIVSIKITEKV